VFEFIYNYVVAYLRLLLDVPFNYGDRFYFLYLASFVVLAYVAYRRSYRLSKTPFLKFLFPRRIYLHDSAKADYLIYLINVFIAPITAVFGVALNTAASLAVATTLIKLNSGQPLFPGQWSTAINLWFFLGFTLTADLSVYIVHRFHHQSNVFWPIHALHHSAEVMTPVTLFRKHPLWNFRRT
jgi:sterol desaturase/sphingolipid hydroxylase (fatty acid hydroxylase superfamily)